MKTRAKWLIKSMAICNDTCCQSLINEQRLPKAKRFGPPGPTGPWRFGQRQSKIILSHCYTLPPFADDFVRTGPTRLKSCSDVQAGRGPHCCPLFNPTVHHFLVRFPPPVSSPFLPLPLSFHSLVFTLL